MCTAGLLVGLLALASPASAQNDNGGPLRFLKPWIERQLFGHETSKPDATAPAESAPAPSAPADAAPAQSEATPDQAAPPGGAPADAATGDDAASSPSGEDSGDDLRGSVTPPDDTSGTDVATPPSPPADATPTEPESRTPGVPVEAKPEALRLAVLAGRSISATMATINPVAEEIQAMLGRPVEILPLASYDAMVDAQAQRRIDGGFYSSAAFAAADAGCACLEPIVAPKASDGTLAYHAIIVARAGAGIASLADLAGKTVAIGAVDSIGARRLQLAGLLSQGLDPSTTFGAVLEVDSAEAAVQLVASGVADAAFAWSSMTGGVENGYSRGTLTNLATAGAVAINSLVVIWNSPPVTHGPFAVLRTLPEADKDKLASYLEALSAGNPDAYDRLDPLYGGGYARVTPQDYAGLETLLTENVDAVRLPAGPETTGATAAAPADATPGTAKPQTSN